MGIDIRIIIVFLIAFLIPINAYATICSKIDWGNPIELTKEAEIIFYGRWVRDNEKKKTTYKIIKSYKGVSSSNLQEIESSGPGGNNFSLITAGSLDTSRNHIILASYDDNSKLRETNYALCSNTEYYLWLYVEMVYGHGGLLVFALLCLLVGLYKKAKKSKFKVGKR